MAETFPFKLVSPTGIVYEGPVEQATAIGSNGEFGVLPNHVDFITSLSPGVVTLKLADGSITEYLLTGGLTEVKDGAMTALADEAIPVAAVDPVSAAPEVQEAEQRLAQMSFYDPGYHAAQVALQISQARADISNRRRTSG
jgi:F-type H+-transporting ATPase subunit epsilon